MMVDPDGDFAFLIPLAIMAVGGAINVAANWDNISHAENGFLTGLGYFGVGFAQTAATMYGGPAGTLIAGGLGGMANAALGGGTGSDILLGGVTGLAGAGIGMAATSATAPLLSKLSVSVGGYTSPLIEGAVKGAIGGAIGGAAAGLGIGLMLDPSNALQYAGRGAISGATFGGISGAATTSIQAIGSGRNPFVDYSRSGMGPVLKGQHGVAMAKSQIQAEGGNILGEQVSLKATPSGPRWVVDIVYEKSSTIYAVEVKTGPGASFTPNQKIVIPQIQETGTAIPVGGNANRAFLQVNETTNIRVRIMRY